MSKKAKIFDKGNRVRGSGKEPDGDTYNSNALQYP